jgi:tetratricopeptide (TPR) repeat protein
VFEAEDVAEPIETRVETGQAVEPVDEGAIENVSAGAEPELENPTVPDDESVTMPLVDVAPLSSPPPSQPMASQAPPPPSQLTDFPPPSPSSAVVAAPVPMMPIPTPAPYPTALYPTAPNLPQGVPVPVPAPEAPRKSRKRLFVILGAASVLIILVVVGIVGFNIYRSNTYDNAVAALKAGDYRTALDAFAGLGDYDDAPVLMSHAQKGLDYSAAQVLLESEDYEGALAAFEALGSFEDAAAKAALCRDTLDYRVAVSDFEAGDFEAALDAFIALESSGFPDAAQWADKAAYAIADKKYAASDFYGAYLDFKALGSYEDAAERMRQCTTSYPDTGELHHHESYVSSSSAIVVDGSNASYASYHKIYAGDDLVSTIFLNPGTTCSIDVPPGNYMVKEATGDAWFGEEIMFGDEGFYEVMIFDDGSDYFTLEYNIEVTISLSVIDGDVGSSPTDRANF